MSRSETVIEKVALALRLLRSGKVGILFQAVHARLYKKTYEVIFAIRTPRLRRALEASPTGKVSVATAHPIAWASPDHLVPFGTKFDNSTNKKFVLFMNKRVRYEHGIQRPSMMDIGCSGGQLVRDFLDLSWVAVGIEGSDYSLKHKRANWADLGGTRLFTCDATKPYDVQLDGSPLRFDLVTAWEVLEHIGGDELPGFFDGVLTHLKPGGYFIASTNSGPSVVDGIELHRTRMTNALWQEYMHGRYPDLEPVDLGLKTYQYVRFDFNEPSFLVFRKAGPAAST